MNKKIKNDINEVSPRDGFQNEAIFIPTEDKIAFINQLSASGFHKIEVSSFTSPKAIPALRDAEMVMHEIQRNPNVIYSALVPNLRGAERAIECKVDEINLVMSLSETHNIANLRMTREQSFAQIKAVIDAVQGSDVAINLSFSTVWKVMFLSKPLSFGLIVLHNIQLSKSPCVIQRVWRTQHKLSVSLVRHKNNFRILPLLRIFIIQEVWD